MQHDDLWNTKSGFFKSAPQEILKDIYDDDKKNYQKMEAELSKEVALLDDSLVLFITSLQGGYSNYDNWKDNVSLKAAVPMATSAFNYLLLARHAVSMGYFAETRDLLRSCHERMTRCYLFYADTSEAQKFLSGEQLRKCSEQEYVDNRIDSILKQKGKTYQALRKMYKSQSSLVHPNLESLSARTPGPEMESLSDRAVKYPIFGGLISSDLGKSYLFAVLQKTLFALSIIGVIFMETAGSWNKEFKRLKARLDAFVKEEKDRERVK